MTETYVPYPDAELVLLDLLESLAPTVTILPNNFTTPIIQVNRIGGAPDNSDITDYPIMRVAFYGANRNASWQLAAQGEGLILGHRCRYIPVAGVGDILLDSADIVVGGQMLPDLDPDDRRVVKDVILGFRRQYHLV